MEKMGGLLERSLVAGKSFKTCHSYQYYITVVNIFIISNTEFYSKKKNNLLLFAGVTVTEVLLSHIVVQYIVLSIQTALMMLVLFVFFDNPMVGSLVWSLSLLFLTGTSGMCYGKVTVMDFRRASWRQSPLPIGTFLGLDCPLF